MTSRPQHPWLAVCSAVSTLVLATASRSAAADAHAEPAPWVVRSYQVPADFFGFPTVPEDVAKAPITISSYGNKENPVAASIIMERGWPLIQVPINTKVLSGMKFPEGTVVVHEKATGSFAFLIPSGWVPPLDEFFQSVEQKVPRTVGFTLDIIQADVEAIRRTVAEAAGNGDHSVAWERLVALLGGERATQVRHLRIETRSGQRATAQEGADSTHASGLILDATGRVEVLREAAFVGTRLEVDPVISPESRRLDVNLALEHHFALPAARHEFAGQAGALGRVESPVTDYHLARVTTAIKMESGSRRLLGVWTPEGAPEFANGKFMQAAFLRADIVPLKWPQNKELAAVLERHLAKAKLPEPTFNKPLIPPGMVQRRFKVPSDFLSLGGPAQGQPVEPPADPFAPAGSTTGAGQPATARGILETQGIQFPEGATARFYSATATLEVINTQANMDQVEAFLGEVHDCRNPFIISHTLHIVEGEAALIQKLTAGTETEADHSAAWKRIEEAAAQGKVRELRTLRVEGRSGQRVLTEAGTSRMSVAELHFGGPGPAPVPSGEKPAGPTDKPAAESTAPPTIPELRLMTAKHRTRMVGTCLELEPILGPDGWTIDMNLALEHHFAPPAEHAAPPASVGATFSVDLPATDFQCARVTTAITFWSGMTRLLGLWKPEGAVDVQGKNLMQAAFLNVELARAEME